MTVEKLQTLMILFRQSVTRDKLMLLGEDSSKHFFSTLGLNLTYVAELDQELLGISPKQKWKASASKSDCRDAYRQACAAMEGGGSGAADAASEDHESGGE